MGKVSLGEINLPKLDFFLISKILVNEVFTCEILNAPETDPSVITLYLKSEKARQHRGPGLWKFNNSLLEEHEYSNRLRENITLFKNKYADVEDLSLKWDLLKMEIRGFTIKYSKIKAKKRKTEEIILQHKANKLLQKSAKNPSDKQLLNELYATKSRLETIMRQKTKGVIIRSKARWREQGERNTRYFFNLEKRNQSRKAVTKLKVGNDKYTFDQFEILEEEKRFYETLYRSEIIDEQSLPGFVDLAFIRTRRLFVAKKKRRASWFSRYFGQSSRPSLGDLMKIRIVVTIYM